MSAALISERAYRSASAVTRGVRIVLAALAALLASTGAAHADRAEKARNTVNDAVETVNAFTADRNYRNLWKLAKDAHAVIVIPTSVRGGLIIGGSGGNGVMLGRKDGGGWSQPAFFRISSLSIGLQAGGEVSELVLVVRSKAGLDQLLGSSVKLGADLSVAAGNAGGGSKVQTTDVIAFSRSQGLYGSISIEGAVLKVNNKWNKAYYGREVSPVDIIYLGKASNQHSAALRSAVARLANKAD